MVVNGWYVGVAATRHWYLPSCINNISSFCCYCFCPVLFRFFSFFRFFTFFFNLVSVNQMEWLTIPAWLSLLNIMLMCFFNKANIEGADSSEICVWCLCYRCVLFYICVWIDFERWLEKSQKVFIYVRNFLKCAFACNRVWVSWADCVVDSYLVQAWSIWPRHYVFWLPHLPQPCSGPLTIRCSANYYTAVSTEKKNLCHSRHVCVCSCVIINMMYNWAIFKKIHAFRIF